MATDPWGDFEAVFYFDEPGDQIEGVLEAISEGNPLRLAIRTDGGQLRWVSCSQARLRAALADWKPRVGERLWILYKGEADKAAPAMNKAKRFKVKVDRPDDQERAK